jgi:hypothetical protein
MTGSIQSIHLAVPPYKSVGGAIRVDGRPDRIPFDAAELVKPLSMADELLGKSVAFDLVRGSACRVRLAKV